MDSVDSDFNKRKDEINEYFSFLEKLNNNNIKLNYIKENATEEFIISIKLQRIFIANTFLLLYNLVESTIRNSIVTIYNKIQDDEITYNDLSEKIKQIWLHKHSKKITSSNEKKIEKDLKKIINHILSNEIIMLTKDDINISGNIYADTIRDLATQIGFEKSSNGRHLEEIKDKRNRLAHGEHTFHDIGKDFTYLDLNTYKETTFIYLEDVISKIKNFIDDEKYKIQQNVGTQ
jgi:ribonucleotide reductase beta subunit family protein with ferritin-like domain